jgi:hypothetical protein
MLISPTLWSRTFVHLVELEVVYHIEYHNRRRQAAALDALHTGIEDDIFPSLQTLRITAARFTPWLALRTFPDSEWTTNCEKFRRLLRKVSPAL